eukprot:TRINITY_DN30518_c0_g2_i2.p1 TRINITY_DN30518_c0_g2~~TRINITY_DN30518_c0_g2_i2.p1  ORF type:complete len:261 (+),score=55.48 TRINITY_DN30518_c0_g2_i2:142-924(+)
MQSNKSEGPSAVVAGDPSAGDGATKAAENSQAQLASPHALFPLADLLIEARAGDFEVLDGARIVVVDVGAMSLGDAEDIWSPLWQSGLCESVVGFEPNETECQQLNRTARTSPPLRSATFRASTATGAEAIAEVDSQTQRERPQEKPCTMCFLPYALGDGSKGEFRLCSAPMTSSMLEPNIPLLRRFTQLEEVTTVTRRSEVLTRRLDDLLPEVGGRIDFLKLDVQGYELRVLQGAENVLRDVLVIHTEACVSDGGSTPP